MSASYYLYQKYEQRGEQEPIPVYPNVFSIDGDGTMPKVIKQENDPNCGYVPPVTPIYRWTNIEVSSDYICDECPTAQYRWVESGVTCVGYDKYIRNIKQKSYDGGSTWTNVSPLEISASTLIETNSIDCGYVPITERKFLLTYNDGSSYSAYCNSSTTLTEAEVKPTYFDNTKMTTAELGDCIRTIGGYAFYNCSGLTSVTIPSGVTEINYNAFNGCTSLTGITVYATTPPTLDSAALTNTNNCTIYVLCDSIDAYKSAPVWNNYSSRFQAILGTCLKFKATYSNGTSYSAECDSSTTLTTATTMPSGYEYSAMTTAEIGNCITSIDEYAFEECSSLTSITIPNSIISIGVFAFGNCRSLTSINIPSGVTSIGQQSFYRCSGLTEVTIPDSVTSIGLAAFRDCSSLASITINATTPPAIGSNALTNTNDCPIFVPASALETYKSASGWSYYASRIQAIS